MTIYELTSKVVGAVFPGATEDMIQQYAGEVAELVEPTLESLAREVAESRKLRHYLLTDPSTVTATLDANGATDLTTIISTNKILLDKLRHGEITHADSVYPLEWLEGTGQGRLAGPHDNLFIGCWLTGMTLHTKNITDAALAGTVGLRVPFIPTLASVPFGLVGKFTAKVTERFKAGRNAVPTDDN